MILLRWPSNRPSLSGREVLDRTALARAYAQALSQAPIAVAQQRFEELFEKLEVRRRTEAILRARELGMIR